MKRKFKMILLILLVIFLVTTAFFFIGTPPQEKEITFGVNFSQKHAQQLGLDAKETLLALLDDLKTKNIKLITHWDLIEPEKDNFSFDDLDWQIEQIEKKGAKIILVIGMKTGRWPECHIPTWAKGLDKKEQQERILNLIEEIVLRYEKNPSITIWDIENEPLFPFGECPWRDKNFVRKEIAQVKSLDSQKRPILISDSGEFSLWVAAAQLGDVVGVTMYKKAWFKELGIRVSYPFPPIFYWRKAQTIKRLFGKEIICVELQAEPWCKNLLYNCSLEEQQKTMNLAQFKYNIEFAKRTGLNSFYLWGAEWWYWLAEKQGQPEIWNEAKKLWN